MQTFKAHKGCAHAQPEGNFKALHIWKQSHFFHYTAKVSPFLTMHFYSHKTFQKYGIKSLETTMIAGALASATGEIEYGFTNDYIFRSFDRLNLGDDYAVTLPAIHIGFLDFTPFPEVPEFYATYKLLNVKNHHLYSGKFSLGVVDLTQTDLATKEDRKWQIDHWARLFKAKTWEELKMIAKENEAMQEASETLYSMHCEQTIRDMARAREDQLRWESGMKKHIAALEANNEKLASNIEKLSSDNEKLSSDNEKLSSELAAKDAEIARLLKLLENAE